MQSSDHPLEKIRFGLLVAIGGEDPAATLAVIAQQRQAVRSELEEVPQRAEALGAEFLEESEGIRAGLLEKFACYSRWLERAEDALSRGDTAAIMELHEESLELLPALTESLDRYARVFASHGPYRNPVCNNLWRLAEAVKSQAVPAAGWNEYLEFYRREVKKKLEGIAPLDLPGRTSLLESYSESLKLLDEMGTNLGKLDRLDARLVAAECLESVMEPAAETGPTRIPATNVLLAAVRSGELEEEQLMGILDDYNEIVEGYLHTFEQAVARPTHSELIREEIPRTLDTLDDHFLLIETLSDHLEDPEAGGIEELLSKIEESARKLIDSRQVYEVAVLHQAHKACPSCARSNPPENRYCEACGEQLPQADKSGRRPSSTFSIMSGPISEETRVAEMTENVARLFQACDDMADSKISSTEFGAELKRAAKALTEFVEEYENQVNIALDESLFSPEEWQTWRANHLPHLEDLAISYYAGIEDMRGGLASMEAYLDESKEVHLVEGVRLYWQGIQAVHRGKLAVESHTKLLEDLMKQA